MLRVCVGPAVTYEHAGEGHSRNQRKDISKLLAGLKTVCEEQKHAQRRDRYSQSFTELWFFPVKDKMYEQHEYRRGELKHYGRRGGGQLIGEHEQDRSGGQEHCRQDIAPGHVDFEGFPKNGKYHSRKQGAEPDDARGVPGYEFEAYPANTPAN